MFKTLAIAAALIILFVALAGYVFFGFGRPQVAKKTSVRVRGQEFRVEIADTPYLRSQGLSGRESLPEDAGMLFVFESASIQTFWMKDMKFPLDIVWIQDGRIVGIEKDVPPEPDKSVFSLKTYTSPAAADRVLEINAGLSQRYGFEVGDQVEL
jgi:uncharacterized membrane protein (UPF0127 family)